MFTEPCSVCPFKAKIENQLVEIKFGDHCSQSIDFWKVQLSIELFVIYNGMISKNYSLEHYK